MTQTSRVDPVGELVRGRDFKLLIGGDLVDAAAGGTLETFNPSTGERLAHVPAATGEDVEAAYAAAAAAQPGWEALGAAGRGEVFARFAEIVRENEERLAMLDAINGGMPFDSMLRDVRISLEHLRNWPELVRWHGGRTIPATLGNLHYTSYKPYGVVGRIIAFNHPAMFAVTKILAALVAGNSVLLKPAPQTPLSALVLGELTRGIFPDGVVNILTGGGELGDAIVTHPRIKRIGFTGSVGTGIIIQQRAATAGIKHVSLELGGKNPMIVFPDANLERAVEGAINGMNFGVSAGQSCGSNSRTYVHHDLHDEFVRRLAGRLEAMHVGPAYEPGVDMGPVVSAQHHDRVMGFVRSGREQGARLVTGGDRPGESAPAGGYFLRPTLFADVKPEMRIASEEIFGPVMSLAAWGDEADVIALANETTFGLTAGVWTSDLDTAHRVADKLEAGYVWVNESGAHHWGTPFGGMKQSGLGREESIEEYESFLEIKSIHVRLRT